MKVGKSSRGVKIKCEGRGVWKRWGESGKKRRRRGGGEGRIEIKGSGGGESFAGRKGCTEIIRDNGGWEQNTGVREKARQGQGRWENLRDPPVRNEFLTETFNDENFLGRDSRSFRYRFLIVQ